MQFYKTVICTLMQIIADQYASGSFHTACLATAHAIFSPLLFVVLSSLSEVRSEYLDGQTALLSIEFASERQ